MLKQIFGFQILIINKLKTKTINICRSLLKLKNIFYLIYNLYKEKERKKNN